MGRKSKSKERKALTPKAEKWLGKLFIDLQNEDIALLSIDDIASLACKSKSTLYEYFSSKEEILLTLCSLRVRSLSAVIQQMDRSSPKSVERFEAIILAFSEGISDISISFLRGIHDNYPDAWSVINAFIDKFMEILRHEYEEGMKRGLYRTVSLDLLTLLDRYFVTQIVTSREEFSDPGYRLSDLVVDYLNLRLRGLVI